MASNRKSPGIVMEKVERGGSGKVLRRVNEIHLTQDAVSDGVARSHGKGGGRDWKGRPLRNLTVGHERSCLNDCGNRYRHRQGEKCSEQ